MGVSSGRWWVLAAFLALAVPARAETPAAPPAAAAGVTPYPASFYAPFQPTTAADMLARTPGFAFDPGQSQRGFASGAGNVLIDGERPSSKTDDLDSILRRIPAGQVARVEVIRGGAPGIDMHGQTVVANVVRRADAGRTAVVAIAQDYDPKTGRLDPSLRLEWSARSGPRSVEGSLLAAGFTDNGYGNGPEVARAPDGAVVDDRRDHSRAGGAQASATAGATTPALGGELKLNGKLQGTRYALYEADRDNDPTLGVNVERDLLHQEQGELGATLTQKPTPTTQVQTLFLQRFQGEDTVQRYATPGEEDRFSEQDFSAESILRSALTFEPAPHLSVEVGAEGDYNAFSTHNRFLSNGALVPLPAADIRFVELRSELLAKATWVVGPRLTLEGGLRYEASDLTSSGDVAFDRALFYAKPRLVATWSPTARDQLRLRLEQEVGQLDFSNFVATTSLTAGEVYAGNPRLVPQRAKVAEIALEHRFWSRGAATLTFRRSAISSVIDRAPVLDPRGAYDAPANIGSGWEDDLGLNLQAPLDRLGVPGGTFKADATWRTSRVRDPTTLVRRPISNVGPRSGAFEFSQDLPRRRLKWGVLVDLGFQRPYYRYDLVEIDRFRTVGQIYAEYRPGPKLSWRLEINSIGADFRRTLEVWPGLRAASAQTETDQRDLSTGPTLHLRVRRDF